MFINHLDPSRVWELFEDICKIPRLSKHEEKIKAYLIDFARSNNLEVKEDSVGNILITKEADPGFEDRKTIVLQSHMDMVGEKDAETVHDWFNDPINPIIEDGWVTARVTTLGADDGIGIAAQMAVITDKSIKSGKIECLFTVDEETGMTGAINLEPNFFESKILINLDSEDEGELFIGCAGGMDTVSIMDIETEPNLDNGQAYKISVTGLHGGHSGDEIHNGYANAVKVIASVLNELNDKYNIKVADIDAGNLRNAIPREAFSTVLIDNVKFTDIQKSINGLKQKFRSEYIDTEPKLSISIEETEMPDEVINSRSISGLVKSLLECPHGVIAWSKTMDNLVETSTNLASVKLKDKQITVVTSQRSSVEASKISLAQKIKEIFAGSGAKVVHTDGYPGWEPNTDSEILKVTEASYQRLFGEKPIVRAIHAGLECGLILEKYPSLDMISFGPTIKGAHTPEERINIVTTLKFWNLLKDVIANIPKK